MLFLNYCFSQIVQKH